MISLIQFTENLLIKDFQTSKSEAFRTPSMAIRALLVI